MDRMDRIFGSLLCILFIHSGIMSGSITKNVNWAPSRAVGARTPTAASTEA